MLEENETAALKLFTVTVMTISGHEYEHLGLTLGQVGITGQDLSSGAKWIRVDQTYWNSDEVQSVTILPQEAE